MNNDKESPYPAQGFGAIRALAMPKDGSFFAYGFASGDGVKGKVRGFKYPEGDTLFQFGKGEDAVEQLIFSPLDGTLAVSRQDGKIQRWDPRKKHSLRAPPYTSRVPVLAFDPNRPVLVMTSKEVVRFWNYKESGWGWVGGEIKLATAATALAFVPDGKYLAVGEAGGDVTLWDVADRKRVHTFRGHRGEVLGLAVCPDGKQLATGGADGTARLWDLRGALVAAGREQP
jgi:WD40 repeat protein